MQSMSQTFSEENYQLICNKQNMPLKFDKNLNIYELDFEIKNKDYDLDKLMDFQIYELIKQVNSDLIKDIKIINQTSENEIDVLFIFHRFGKNAGIPQKYLHLTTIRQKTTDLIIFSSKDSINSHNIDTKDIQKIDCKFAHLTIIPFKDKFHLNYKFSINIKEDLPLYMENMIGLLMKKIFYNLKVILEKE